MTNRDELPIVICGCCVSARSGAHVPEQCERCGAWFAEGSPAVVMDIEITVRGGVRIEPVLTFIGHWEPGLRRQIEDACAPKREALRLVKAGYG